ncbi:MAG: OB-fold nucleic acid binding domain-containing protein [Anaerolineae bacterium]|nr:OB-fold nucleic acid binding domain-containing protein [Anaerolineae bacterium]MCX8067538.1 OB-fold nucleic acid binding domain-containing protein [Anaerolineae bacterium]
MWLHRLRVLFGLLLTLVWALAGCGQPVASPTPTPLSLPPTRPAATATPAPTATRTPRPTPTPRPTRTPTPSPTPTETPTPLPPTPTPIPITPIGRLRDYLEQEVTVAGNVVETAYIYSREAKDVRGFLFTLDDGTGQVKLLMWLNVYDDCWDARKINVGARVRATGQVKEYAGQLEIIPRWGGAVKALKAAGPSAPPRAIGSLTEADKGQRVQIEGSVTRIEPGETYVRVFVNDGSGEVLVFIWRSIYDRIRGREKLETAGTSVRVVGRVDVYRGTLEVIPTLPYDVVVNP